MYTIYPVQAFADNYIWLIVHTLTRNCIIVDPGEHAPVLEAIQTLKLNPKAILITHHHHDHTGGARALSDAYTLPIHGPNDSPYQQITHPVQDGEQLKIDADHFSFYVIGVPGHTLDHIAYQLDQHLFCGDTLFSAGCGRCFEGTHTQLYTSLCKLAALPPETLIYCAHEYTAGNLKFAQHIEPRSQAIQKRIDEVHTLALDSQPSLPSTLRIELMTNPFLRCEVDDVKRAANLQCGHPLSSAADVFGALREWKNEFRPNDD